MKINLHIERVLLEGLPVEHRNGPAIRRAIEAELTRLFATGGLSRELPRSQRSPRIQGGILRLTSQTPPAELGRGIAGRLHEVIRPSSK